MDNSYLLTAACCSLANEIDARLNAGLHGKTTGASIGRYANILTEVGQLIDQLAE